MDKEGLSVLTEKERLYLFPEEEELEKTEAVKKNDEGKEVKGFTVKVQTKTSTNKNVERRRNIQKFTQLEVRGDTEEVVLLFPNQIAQAEEAEKEVNDEDLNSNKGEIICSKCGQKGHYAYECTNDEKQKEEKKVDPNAYVAPSMRNGAQERNDIQIKLGNLPPGTDDVIVRALYAKVVGNERQIIKIFFPRDRETQKLRDFCFITLATKEIAENAIEKLDGYLLHPSRINCVMAERRRPF